MTTLAPLQLPPDLARLLEVFRRVVPTDYYQPIADGPDGPDPSYALFRAIGRALAVVAEKGGRSVSARYALPSALQRDEPASTGQPARGTVVLSRTGPSADALLIGTGRMRLVFDGGDAAEDQGAREYINATPITWGPNETRDQSVEFICDVDGFVGNLTFAADLDGLVPLDLIEIKDQSQDRANVGGTILFGSQSILQDTGTPDVFAADDVGLYVRIDDASTPANVGVVRRIAGFDWPEVEVPGTGRYPYRVFLEDLQLHDAVEVFQDDGGAYTDFTELAAAETGSAITILPAAFVVNDAAYFAFTREATGVTVEIITPGDGDWSIAWEYWNGATWVAFTGLDDPTNGFLSVEPGVLAVQWARPTDWAVLASPQGTGNVLRFLRARVSALVTLTTAPVVGRVVMLVPEPLDGVVDAAEVYQDDGGVLTNYTTPAASNAPDDVALLPATPAINDATYFALDSSRFSSIEVRITTPGAGVWSVAWEYYTDGGVWAELPDVVDGTNAFRTAGTNVVSWIPSTDWDDRVSPLTAVSRVFVRARVSSYTSISAQPLAARVRLGALLDDGSVKWTLLDFADLGLTLSSVEAFDGGRDDDLYLLGDERGVYQQAGEPDDVFRDRIARLAEVVTPRALLAQINRILRPLGYTGAVHDVQFDGIGGGFYGLFCDVDADLAPDFVSALDLYADGDAYPVDPLFVLQSANEAYGWFIVRLPYLGQGDFGVFLDEGPVYYDALADAFYGPAFSGFMDGSPTLGNATYAAVHAAITATKAGGVGFSMTRSLSLSIL